MMTSGVDFNGSPGGIVSATHGDAELEADRLASVIDDVVVLVDTLLDRASQGHGQAACFELELRRREPRVGHHMASREEAHRAGVQELRPLAADGQLVARDEACVACVEPAIASALDATIRLHDQDVVIAVDGDVGGADLNCVDHS